MSKTEGLTKEVFSHLVRDGKKFKEIAEIYGCNPAYITMLAKKYGIKAKTSAQWRDKAATLNYEELVGLYVREEMSAAKIAKRFEVSPNVIRRALVANNIRTRSKGEGSRLRRSQNLTFDLDVFRKDSPVKYYLLGLIASDGTVSGNAVSITSKDIDVINYIKDVLKCSNKVGKTFIKISNGSVREYYQYRFSSSELVEILDSHGIVPNKSLTLAIKNIPDKYARHFVRGVFDGDGSVSLSRRTDNNARCQDIRLVTASKEFSDYLEDVLSNLAGMALNKTTLDKRSTLYTVRTSRRSEVVKFARWIYGEDLSEFGMRRKKDKLIRICEAAW